MRILPVMDLKGATVVHAVAGRRHDYQPIRSQLAADANPANIAKAFADECGFREVYIADLDAIAGAEPDWETYDRIAKAGLRLVIDAGIATAERASRLGEFSRRTSQLAAAVVGSEAIRDGQGLRSTLEIHGSSHSIFSLDLRQGRPIVANPAWSTATPLEIIADVVAAGYRRFIVLDLIAVGAGEGPVTVDLCRRIREQNPRIELISGGGIRHAGDVQSLCDAGCDQVLVASALHDGRLRGNRTESNPAGS